MRDKNTGAKEFRELLEEISMLMVYEVTRDLPTEEIDIETPLCMTKSRVLSGKKVGIIPGSAFYTIDEAKNGRDAFRISFAKVDPQTAEEGIKRLAEAFKEYR